MKPRTAHYLHVRPHTEIPQREMTVRFSIYGNYELDVVREGDKWRVFNLNVGKRVPLTDVVIPTEVQENEIATYLDDLFHELAKPGQAIRRVS